MRAARESSGDFRHRLDCPRPALWRSRRPLDHRWLVTKTRQHSRGYDHDATRGAMKSLAIQDRILTHDKARRNLASFRQNALLQPRTGANIATWQNYAFGDAAG